MDSNSVLPPELHQYWSEVAQTFQWKKKWDTLQSGNFDDVNIEWFKGARLNITENCLDRHLEKGRHKKALIFEPNNRDEPAQSYTYEQLHSRVCSFANLLKKKGMKKGDIVCFYMGMTPELMIGILACARLGIVHMVVYGSLSSLYLRERLVDSRARMIITHDGSFRADKMIPLKERVDEAIQGLESVETVVVVQRAQSALESAVQMKMGRDYFYEDLIVDCEYFCPIVEVEAEDPLFILYTSGSTGKPKGLLHTTAGYMVHVGNSFKDVFQIKENDVFWCTADIGWITGHSYLIYGPLLNGSTTVMFEGVPNYPSPSRFWEVIEKHQVTHFYTAPTAIRSLAKFGSELPMSFPMNSLKPVFFMSFITSRAISLF